MAEDARDTKGPQWPYTSFKTLNNLIQRFAADEAIPARIDRSVLPGSEGQKTQVMAAMRFLGLIGENGEVTPALTSLVNDEKTRPQQMQKLLEEHYPEATRLAKMHATTKQLEESFTGLTGDTLRKAMTFYLHAAKYANHPVSKHFKVKTGYSSRNARRQRGAAGAGGGAGNGSGEAGAEAARTPPAPLVDAKSRYLDMLMEKAKQADELDTELLDRIERLLGYEQQ